jgi:hypothetical protein
MEPLKWNRTRLAAAAILALLLLGVYSFFLHYANSEGSEASATEQRVAPADLAKLVMKPTRVVTSTTTILGFAGEGQSEVSECGCVY